MWSPSVLAQFILGRQFLHGLLVRERRATTWMDNYGRALRHYGIVILCIVPGAIREDLARSYYKAIEDGENSNWPQQQLAKHTQDAQIAHRDLTQWMNALEDLFDRNDCLWPVMPAMVREARQLPQNLTYWQPGQSHPVPIDGIEKLLLTAAIRGGVDGGPITLVDYPQQVHTLLRAKGLQVLHI